MPEQKLAKARTTAIVEFKVEVHLNQPWGDDLLAGEILEYARKEATEQLFAIVSHRPNVRPIGNPRVTLVMVAEE